MKKVLTQKNLILRIIPSLFLIVASIAMGIGVSYAWLSKNTQVQANNVQLLGAQIQPHVTVTNGSNTVTYTAGESIVNLGNIELTVPGSYQDISVTVYNSGTQSFSLDKVGIAALADGEEVARTVNGTGYYLGTQISTKILTGGGIASTGPVYLIPTAGNGSTTFSAVVTSAEATAAPTAGAILFYNSPGSIVLKAGESISFTIRMTLENDPLYEQNGYKHFGRSGYNGQYYVDSNLGTCSRRLFVICNPVK